MLNQVDVLSAKKINAIIKETYNVDYNDFASNSYRRRVQVAMETLGAKDVEDLILKIKTDKNKFQVFNQHLRVD